MIKFEKVSFEQFKKDCINCGIECTDEEFNTIYEGIKLPDRGTPDSAGYDFYSPFYLDLKGEYIAISKIMSASVPPIEFKKDYTKFPTGIRFVTDRTDIFLMCVPRSGLGFKKGVRLRNSVGIIDSFYHLSDNEGHIMVNLGSDEPVQIEAGKAFMQGIILPYFTVDDEDTSKMKVRNGGFGSTNR